MGGGGGLREIIGANFVPLWPRIVIVSTFKCVTLIVGARNYRMWHSVVSDTRVQQLCRETFIDV